MNDFLAVTVQLQDGTTYPGMIRTDAVTRVAANYEGTGAVIHCGNGKPWFVAESFETIEDLILGEEE